MEIILICSEGITVRINYLILVKQFEHKKHYLNEGEALLFEPGIIESSSEKQLFFCLLLFHYYYSYILWIII